YNSPKYIHTVYKAMNLAFADRDFYYGDPYFAPTEPITALLSKDYAKERAKLINPDRNDPEIKPGDPYAFQKEKNPFAGLLENWKVVPSARQTAAPQPELLMKNDEPAEFPDDAFYGGTTSVQAAD